MKETQGLEFPDFELGVELGSGAVGTVYAARLADGTPCAVKRLNSMAVDRAFSAAALRRLFKTPPHENVLPVLAGTVERTPYFVAMPLAERNLAGSTGLDEREAWLLIRQMAEGMGHLHKHGVPHGNLHPGNVFLEEGAGGAPLLKVADSGQGLAGRVHHIDLAENTYWAAPEQLEDPAHWEEGAAERWDVYRFGVIAFWLINGRLPRGENHIQWRRKALAESGGRPVPIEPGAVAAFIREAPGHTWDRQPKTQAMAMGRALVDRCLSLDPPERPVDLREVRNEFERMEASFALEDAERRVHAERRKQSAKLFTSRSIACGMAAALIFAAVFLVRYLQESHIFRSRVDQLQQVVSSQNGRIAETERQWTQTRQDLKTSRAAADAFFSEIARTEGPGASSFDKKELETSRGYYQKTLDEAQSEIEKARARYSLAHIELRLGEREDARASFRQSIDSFERLLASGTADAATEMDLWGRLADAQEQMTGLLDGPSEEQLAAMRSAVAYLAKLRGRAPGERGYLVREALLQQRLGGLLHRFRRFHEAVAAYGVAGTALGTLRTAEPSADLDDLLSMAQFETGLVLRDSGQTSEAIDAHLAAFETLTRLENHLPGGLSPLQKLRMARGYLELGELFGKSEMEGERIKDVLFESLRILRPVVDSRPDFGEAILCLSRTCRRISALEADSNRWGDGLKLSMEAVKNIEGLAEKTPDDIEVLLELAETRADHARMLGGKTAAAAATVEKGLGVAESAAQRLASLEPVLPQPVRRTHEIRLARLYDHYGELCRQLGIRDKAASCYGRAVARWELLAQAGPTGTPEDWITASLQASRTLLDQATQ